MNLLENYNTARQKYGIELVKQLSELGLPPQYLLSACRFVKENSIPLSNMINQFKEWTKFVIKYNKYDVNRLSYDDFLRIISQEKSKHIVPNLIWQNEIASLGKLNNAKDVQKIPVKNQWCIKSQNWFDRYTDKGYVFFVIYLPNEPLPFTFVVVAVCGGNVEYYDTQDYEQFEDLRGGNENNSDHEVYQRKLPNEIVSYLYDIAATQTEERENKIKTENKDYKINKNMKKQVIRLTEGDLHNIIKESVNNVLNENQYGTVSENPEINQLWNELMMLKNGLIKDIIRKYAWGKTSDQIGGKVVVKQIMAINNAIGTFNSVLQGTTADNEEYWNRIEHEQD